MSILSGINGAVAAGTGSGVVHSVGKWDWNIKAEIPEYASSATEQAMDRVAGNDDWDGNYSAYGDTPAAFPGDVAIMYGFLDDTHAIKGTSIFDEFSLNVDIEGGKEIEHSAKFSCNYSPYNGVAPTELNLVDTESSLVDSGAVNVLSAVGCGAAISVPGSNSWAMLADVSSMSLSIKTANKMYRSSNTYNPATGRNWPGRVRGNMDLTCSIKQYALPSQLIQLKKVYGLRIYTSPPTFDQTLTTLDNVAVCGSPSGGRYWEINWVIFQTHSGIEADRKSVNIIGATTNGGLKGVYSIGGTPTRGSIIAPGAGRAWWPWALPCI